MTVRVEESPPLEQVVGFLQVRVPDEDRVLLRADLETRTATRLRVVLARDETGEPVGAAYARTAPGMPSGTVRLHVATREDVAGQGLATRLRAEALAGHDPGGRQVACLRDGDPVSSAVAEHWGFRLLQRSLTHALDLSSGTAATACPRGVTVERCDDLAPHDEAALEGMLLASQTNPEVEHGLVLTLAGLRSTPTPDQQPVAVLARVDGHPAALSVAVADGDQMHVVYTGVHPSYRGRDLARATKRRLHADARALGVRSVLTDHAPDNTGIGHVNDTLGYRPHSAWLWVARPGAGWF